MAAKLKSITIPKTVERVAQNAFADNLTVKYDGLEMSVQEFFVKLKQRQREITYNQLQGFAIIDKNKRWRKSINIIKKSNDKQSAQKNLTKKLGLSDYQAEICLDCRIAEICAISYMNMKEKIDKF